MDEIKNSLQRLLNYLEHDEEKGWLESGKPKDHIYNDVRRLREWTIENGMLHKEPEGESDNPFA